MSMPLTYRCTASGHEYTEYATQNNPDASGHMACPVCGKGVKLSFKYRSQRRRCTVIPAHNHAEYRAAKA